MKYIYIYYLFRQQFINDPNIGSYFPRPVFRVVVLFVDEKEVYNKYLYDNFFKK